MRRNYLSQGISERVCFFNNKYICLLLMKNNKSRKKNNLNISDLDQPDIIFTDSAEKLVENNKQEQKKIKEIAEPETELSLEAEKFSNFSEDSVQIYLKNIGKIERLSFKEELELATKIRSSDIEISRKASRKLVMANLKLVVSIARKFSYSQVPLLDLIQEGNTGLIRAAEKFDGTLGYRFSTYAAHWIKQSISKCVSQRKRPFKLPQHIVEKLNKINRISDDLYSKLGRAPTETEISSQTEEIKSELDFLHELDVEILSLDMSLGKNSEASLSDIISDSEEKIPDKIFELNSLRLDLEKVLSESLTEEERNLICMRFGINKEKRAYSVEEIAKLNSVPRDKIKKDEIKVLRKLKYSSNNNLKDYLI